MSPEEKKQLKNMLKMFAKAHKYVEGKGLIGVYAMGYQLSSGLFNELFEGQFKKKRKRADEYQELVVNVDGHEFFCLEKK